MEILFASEVNLTSWLWPLARVGLICMLALMRSASGAEYRQLIARLQPPQALGSFLRRRCCPQGDPGLMPALEMLG
jgi:hypothetical protein